MYYFQQIFTSILLDQILVLKREFSERYLILREIRMPIPHIDSYQFGKIVIDGVTHTKDVILLPTKTISNWWRTEGHFLDISDLDDVFITNLEVLVVGQGANSRMKVKTEVEDALQAAGIELISLPTQEACKEYNLRSAKQITAAALHLTC